MKTKESYQEENAGVCLLKQQSEENDGHIFLLQFNSILQFLITLTSVLLH